MLTEQEALKSLAKFSSLPNGVRIRIRRAMGSPEELTARDRIYANSTIPEQANRHERQIMFFIFGLAEANRDKDDLVNIKDAAAKVCKKEESEGRETMLRRMGRLIDMSTLEWELFLQKLTSTIRILESKEFSVSEKDLMLDLLNWEDPCRRVQSRWERAISAAINGYEDNEED